MVRNLQTTIHVISMNRGTLVVSYIRSSDWLRLTIASAVACAAALAFFGYMANGIVVGDLVGVPGREPDIAVARFRGTMCALVFAGMQLGVAATIFTGMRIGTESSPGARFIARTLSAITLSLLLTFLCGGLIALTLKLTQ